MILNRIIICRLNSFLSQFGTIEPVFTALSDSFRMWRKRRALLTALFSAVCFLVGLIMCTEVSKKHPLHPSPPPLSLSLSLGSSTGKHPQDKGERKTVTAVNVIHVHTWWLNILLGVLIYFYSLYTRTYKWWTLFWLPRAVCTSSNSLTGTPRPLPSLSLVFWSALRLDGFTVCQ